MAKLYVVATPIGNLSDLTPRMREALEECDGDLGDSLWFDFADGRFSPFDNCVRGERASLSTYHVLRQCAGLTFDAEKTSGGRKRALRLLKAYLTDKMEMEFENLGELIRLYDET